MRRRTRPTTLPIGLVSEATLRPEDLIPRLIDVLGAIRLTKDERKEVRDVARRFAAYDEADLNEDAIDLSDDVQALEDIASAHAPDYAYYGSTEGDGACFGVWPSFGAMQDDGVRRGVCRVDEASTDDNYFLEVNDHGNATLYRRAGRRWLEVWSVV